MELFFGSVPAALTTALVAAMIVFMVVAYRRREKITKWGRLIALFFGVGIVISAMSATRDNYALPGAVFAMESVQTYGCMALGGAIAVVALVSVFVKKQAYKGRCFALNAGLFVAMVAFVEVSRILIIK